MRRLYIMMLAGMVAAAGQDYRDTLVSVVLQGKKVDSPRITIAPDGRMLACARQLEPGPATTRVFASDDLGKTWETIHDFEHNWYGPSFFTVGDDLYLFLRGTQDGGKWQDLVLGKSTDSGRHWQLTTVVSADKVSNRITTGNAPVLVTDELIVAAISDWGGTGTAFPQTGRVACGWCPVTSDPMISGNWTWTPRLEMPDPNTAPHDKGGWLEPNPVFAPNGDLLMLVRVDADDGELGAVVRVDMARRQLEFVDRFPAEPGQCGFFRLPGGGNGMFFASYDEASRRYLLVSNPRTGGAVRLWGHTRIRNCLALFESTDLYHWRWVRALIKDDQDHDWKTSARYTGFQQPSWVTVGDDLYAVSRTAYDGAANWHDANRITVHKLADFRGCLDADGEVARYTFDSPDDLGFDASRQGGNKADIHGVTYDENGHTGGCARFDGKGFLDLRYRVSSEFHYAEQVTIAAWIKPDKPEGQIVDFPIDEMWNGMSVSLRDGTLTVGGRSCREDTWQKVAFPFTGLNAWHHMAIVIDFKESRIRAWIDGQEARGEGEVSYGSPFYKRHLPSKTDVIGKAHSGRAAYVGRLDDMRFFHRALSEDEIRELP